MGAVVALRNAILDAILNNVALQYPNVYFSLHTDDPGTTGLNEVAGGSYARIAPSFAAASGGNCVTDTDTTFNDMPAATVTHVGIWDAAVGGNFLWKGVMVVPQTTGAGDSLLFVAGDISFPTTGA